MQVMKNKQMNKPNNNKHIDTENREVVTREVSGREGEKWWEELNCMVTHRKYTFDDEHAEVYTEVEM